MSVIDLQQLLDGIAPKLRARIYWYQPASSEDGSCGWRLQVCIATDSLISPKEFRRQKSLGQIRSLLCVKLEAALCSLNDYVEEAKKELCK